MAGAPCCQPRGGSKGMLHRNNSPRQFRCAAVATACKKPFPSSPASERLPVSLRQRTAPSFGVRESRARKSAAGQGAVMDQHHTNVQHGRGSAGRAAMLATASALALLCSAPLQAQAGTQPAQTPAGPTGAAQNQQGANPASAPTPQSSADATSPPGDNEIVVTGTRAAVGRGSTLRRRSTCSPTPAFSIRGRRSSARPLRRSRRRSISHGPRRPTRPTRSGRRRFAACRRTRRWC